MCTEIQQLVHQLVATNNIGLEDLLNQQLLTELRLPQDLNPKICKFGLEMKRLTQQCGNCATILMDLSQTQPKVLNARMKSCQRRLLHQLSLSMDPQLYHCLSRRSNLLVKMTARKIWKENHTDVRPVHHSTD